MWYHYKVIWFLTLSAKLMEFEKTCCFISLVPVSEQLKRVMRFDFARVITAVIPKQELSKGTQSHERMRNLWIKF